jgi:hypothetical protein
LRFQFLLWKCFGSGSGYTTLIETKEDPDLPIGTVAKEKFELVLKEDNVLQTKEDLAPQFCVSRRGEGVQNLMASGRLNIKGFHL